MFSRQRALLLIGDISVLIIACGLTAVVRFDIGAQGAHIWYQIKFFILLLTLWLIIFFIFELYNLRNINPNPRTIGLLIAAMSVNIAISITLFYLTPSLGITPKTTLIILVGSALVLLIIWRRVFYFLFTKHLSRKIALIGTTPLISELVKELSQQRHLGTVVGKFDSIPKETLQSDLIIADGVHPEELLQFSRVSNTETYSVLQTYETMFAKIPLELMNDERALSLLTKSVNAAQSVIYRILEIIIALVVLIITSPLFLIAIFIRYIEDGAPVLYSQIRVGRHGKLFKLYKIRSMHKSAETEGVAWAQERDKRVTVIGRILRKTHIDEIPQMWNIIKGDIALIGPRAERPEFVAILEKEIPYYYLRHTIKPGFTGWAQIKYRYARTIEDSREKFEYDLYYLKNKHPLLDIGILLKTLQIIFTH